MKKTVFSLAIIMALVFTGMQSAIAQISVEVNWTLCDDTCFTWDDCRYRADVIVYNQCGEEQFEMCKSFETADCWETSATVDLDCSCLDTSTEPCYLVVVTVHKLCIGHGGTITVCSGYGYDHFTCGELMNGVSVESTWQ
ncbi:MAG: hypothetical protein RBS55_12910 [Bacteroidales bacterium]|jgi:hypothetical protein|nr:hypothetical protein [Bacteroidales bacterium]